MKLVDQISARIFCQQSSGGNPVTIFAAAEALTAPTQTRLAQSCKWESVFVDRSTNRLSFYMPNGDPVAFCAHAAMGGATILSKQTGTPVSMSIDRVDRPQETCTAVVLPDDIVALNIRDSFSFQKLPHPPAVLRILRDKIGLEGIDLAEHTPDFPRRFPTFCNVTVFGRPKTLIYINAGDRLHSIEAPPVGPAFEAACFALQSTGIYMYTPTPEGYECRQFPKSSGYPEDPATGVAAAALACALHQAGYTDNIRPHRFFQGTAMQRPSVLLVEDVEIEDDASPTETDDRAVSFRLIGQVQEDERETIEVEDTHTDPSG